MKPLIKHNFIGQAAWFLPLVIVICMGCNKGGSSDPDITPDQTDFSLTEDEKTQSAAQGFGNSTAVPTGLPFSLPTGLKIEDDIVSTYGAPPDSALLIGGNDLQYVPLLFKLVNSTTNTIRLILPQGLIFISNNTVRQNGLLVQTDTLVLKPGYTVVQAGLYCLNENRLAAGGGDSYQLGPVTQLPAMVSLLQLVSTKSVAHWSTLTVSQAAKYSFSLQEAVWQVAHTGKLPAGLRTQLEQLP